jgi:hypothetical protein
VFFENPPRYTISKVGAKNVKAMTAGALKNRMTAMLAVVNDGTKLPAFAVFNGRRYSDQAIIPSNTIAFELQRPAANGYPVSLIYDTQEKGWFDDDITHAWYSKV